MLPASIRQTSNPNVLALDVAIVDADGNQITSIGGGGGGPVGGSNANIILLAPSLISQVLAPANLARKDFMIYNGSAGTLFGAYGPTASPNLPSFVIPAHSQDKFTGYTGVISGVWSDGAPAICTLTEVLP